MTEPTIPLTKLEEINDLIARAIDEAGPHAELVLAKALYHLAAHAAPVEALRAALSAAQKSL